MLDQSQKLKDKSKAVEQVSLEMYCMPPPLQINWSGHDLDL